MTTHRWHLYALTDDAGCTHWLESERPHDAPALAAAWHAAEIAAGTGHPPLVAKRLYAVPGFRRPVPALAVRVGPAARLEASVAAALVGLAAETPAPEAGPPKGEPLQIGPFLMLPSRTADAWTYSGSRGWALMYELDRDPSGAVTGAHARVLAPGGHVEEERQVASRGDAEDLFCGYRYRI